jgi:hypothetical protein
VDRLRELAAELVRENVDVVKDIIRNLEHNVGDLIGYIMTDGPGADRRTTVLSPGSGRENGQWSKGAGRRP